ncbi:Holliday junction ATP-dependent DNA helicase RuvA [Streptococcus sanguinis SK330]|jgi:hypothetical protein|uniref:Holliday junction ATP-dependent DNA helicase RuvA n=1 Tax=Streptococcus sanguinis SK330 TaxID=888813 RepID=F2C7H2_STRSA|nr:Holliday junction ATP-dependent DNA helicase RuvA [Streptococcus sanguinis SK330]
MEQALFLVSSSSFSSAVIEKWLYSVSRDRGSSLFLVVLQLLRKTKIWGVSFREQKRLARPA